MPEDRTEEQAAAAMASPLDVTLSRNIKVGHAQPVQNGRRDTAEADRAAAKWMDPARAADVALPDLAREPSVSTSVLPESLELKATHLSSLVPPEAQIVPDVEVSECPDFETASRRAVWSMGDHIGRLSGVESFHKRRGLQTISASTVQLYRDRAHSLLTRYIRRPGAIPLVDDATSIHEDERIDPVDFVRWLIRMKPDISSSTWRSYKAAIAFYLYDSTHPSARAAAAILDGVSADDGEAAASEGVKGTKFFRLEDYNKLLKFCLDRGRGVGADNMFHFARAAIRTGMRPSEWATCDLRTCPNPDAPYGRNVWLFVCNAKASNGRANGLVRVLDLSPLSRIDIEPIRFTMALFQRQAPKEGTEPTIRRLRQAINHIGAATGMSAKYSPYSFRHQAIANWKTIYSPVEVAALAGHSVPETATEHYGRKRDGWTGKGTGGIMIRPSRVDVERIMSRIRSDNPAPFMRPDGSLAVVPEDMPTPQ